MSRCNGPLWVALVVSTLACFPQVAAAEERPIIEITPGRERVLRVAVQRFRDDFLPPDAERADRLLTAIEEGLDFNGVLLPLARAAFLGPADTKELAAGRRSDCIDFKQSGADALVDGVIRGKAGAVTVEYRVFDTSRCARLLHTELVRPPSQLHRAGFAIADEIVRAFTGVRGASDTEIAFISTRAGGRQVYVIDADGRRARPATTGQSIKAFPDWLPGGDGVLYTSYLKNGLPDVFLSSRGRVPAGRILRNVLAWSPKYRGVFAPGGEELALVATVDAATDIFRVQRDGKELLQLTSNGDVIDVSPSWSPDGQRIAFVSDRSGSPQIYVMDRNGRKPRRITFTSSYSATPAWSPDGRWIAYGVRTEGQFDLYLMDPEGETIVPLVVHHRNDQSPSWSPDGRKIVFSSDRRGHADLYVIDVNGGRLQRLTRGDRDNTSPTWGHFPAID